MAAQLCQGAPAMQDVAIGPAARTCQPQRNRPRRGLPASVQGAVPGEGTQRLPVSCPSAEVHAHIQTTEENSFPFWFGYFFFCGFRLFTTLRCKYRISPNGRSRRQRYAGSADVRDEPLAQHRPQAHAMGLPPTHLPAQLATGDQSKGSLVVTRMSCPGWLFPGFKWQGCIHCIRLAPWWQIL